MKDRICLWHICQLLRFTLRMVAMASKPTARAPGGIVASVRQQMKLSAKLTVNGEDRPIDVADKTVAENDVRDFPVPPLPDIWQSAESGNARRRASGLASQRLVREFGQFRIVLAERHIFGIRPRRLAMILSTIRFGSTDVITCRIGSGVI